MAGKFSSGYSFFCTATEAQDPGTAQDTYPSDHCCLHFFLSKLLPPFLLPGASTDLSVCTGSSHYVYYFFYIRPFNHQQTVSALRRTYRPQKTCPGSQGRTQALVGCFCSFPGPLHLLQGQQSHRLWEEKKKSSKRFCTSHLASLLAIFPSCNAKVIFMQGGWGEGTDAAPASSLLSSHSQRCSHNHSIVPLHFL